eukprot:2454929-Karenia_brevis.AAC.1
MQVCSGRYFLHEHPCSATSWALACVREVLKMPGVEIAISDLCQYGLQTRESGKVGYAKKPTKFMGNCPSIMKRLRRRCNGDHSHIHLMSGRAKGAAIYPKELCAEICRGLKEQEEEDFKKGEGWLNEIIYEKEEPETAEGMAYDDVKGGELDHRLVKKAREEEM